MVLRSAHHGRQLLEQMEDQTGQFTLCACQQHAQHPSALGRRDFPPGYFSPSFLFVSFYPLYSYQF